MHEQPLQRLFTKGNDLNYLNLIYTSLYIITIAIFSHSATGGDDDCVTPIKIGGVGGLTRSREIEIVDNTAYLADAWNGIRIIDISTPSNPVLLSTFTPLNISFLWQAQDVKVVNQTAYISGVQFLITADVSDPTNPTELSRMSFPQIVNPPFVTGLDLAGNFAFVADKASKLHTIDISNPSAPQLLSSYTPLGFGALEDVDVENEVAYVAAGDKGVKIVDVSDPTNPTFIRNISMPGYAQSIKVLNNIAYVALGESGLRMYRVENPLFASFIGSYDTPDEATGVDAVGTTAYVTDDQAGLHILDVSDPSSITLIATYNSPGHANAVVVVDEVAYLADGSSSEGFQAVSVTDSCNPLCKADISKDGTLDFFDVSAFLLAFGSGDLAADFTADGELDFFDVSAFLIAFAAGCP